MQSNSVDSSLRPGRGLFRVPLPMFVLLFFFAILLTRFAHDGDIFWHIATGRWILSHAAVPHQDIFSLSMVGAPWTAHEWLAAVIFALAFATGGWPAVSILTAFSAALAYAILLRFLLTRLQPLYAVPLTALAFFLSLHHFLLRPHVLAMPLLVFWVSELVDAADRGRAPSMRGLWVLWLWANLHGSFTFGLMLAAALAIDAFINARSETSRSELAFSWLRFLTSSLIVSMITPYGYQGLLFPSLLYGHPYLLDMITEWQSPNFHDPQALEFWLLLFLGYALTNGLRLPALRLVLLLGLVHMALHHIRHVAVLGLVSPLLLAEPLRGQGADKSLGHHGTRSFNGFCERFAGRHSRFSLSLSLSILLVAIGWVVLKGEQPLRQLGAFKGIELAQRLKLTGPVLNNPGFGGPLIFEGIAPFIDGRLDLYGEPFLRRYLTAVNLQDPQVLSNLLDQYAIRWTMFDPGRPLIAWLELSGQWKRIYEDRFVVVQVKCDEFTTIAVCRDSATRRP